MALSPADFAVITGGLRSVANEMGEVMMRAAHSTIIRESKDCSTCVLDAHGDTVTQAETVPLHMNSLAAAFDHMRRKYDLKAVRPGEAFIVNNAYENGQHLNDILLFLPVFESDLERLAAGGTPSDPAPENDLVAFVATIAHHLEVGGAFAGSNANATEIFQEGLILPAMKIQLEKDLYGGPVEQILEANVRCPDVVIGDFRAQVSAVLRGRARILELIQRYGRPTLTAAMAALQDYSERAMRGLIERIPDGVYRGEDFIDGFQPGDPLVPIRATVTIRGSEAEVDLTESADQVSWPINVPVASSQSAAFTVFAGMLGPEGVTNAGTYRPITIKTRPGSILEPKHPAPVRGRMTGSYRAATAIKQALGAAAPDLVPACGCDATCVLTMSHKAPDGRYGMFTEILNGGNGGASLSDGAEAVAQMLSNTANAPTEAIERAHPFVRIQEYALVQDTGGAGTHHGGLGIRKRYEVLVEEVLLSTNGDRQETAPWGLVGGQEGSRTTYVIERAGSGERELVPAASVRRLYCGDVFEMTLPGGAGWGPPERRALSAIQDDLRTGRVSAAAARAAYPQLFRSEAAAE